MRERWEVGDAQWKLLEPILRPRVHRDGRGRTWHDTQAVLKGVLWVLGTGVQWRELCLVIRWEYHAENFLGMVRLGCMKIMLRYL
jgi:transposase